MASATTRPTFSFHLLKLSQPKPKSYIDYSFPLKPLHKLQRNYISVQSTDVSKEDTPIQQPTTPPTELDPEPKPKFDKRRLEEKFVVLNTGMYECRSCGYKYDESVGDPSYPIPAGLPFEKLPEDWRCSTCGAAKSFFESKRVEIAGFAQNQQYGLGGNALTSGQKALLIYGSLLFFFVLFLLGYFLQ